MPTQRAVNAPEADHSEGYARSRNSRSCDALLERLCRHHPEQSPDSVREFYSRRVAEVETPAAAEPEPSPEELEAKKISDWVLRQRQLHPTLRDWNQIGGVPVSSIQNRVCKEFGISRVQLFSQRKTRKDLVPARQAAIYLTRELTAYSFPEIGRKFGRDHSTVIHAVRQAEIRLSTDPAFAARVRALQSTLQGEATND